MGKGGIGVDFDVVVKCFYVKFCFRFMVYGNEIFIIYFIFVYCCIIIFFDFNNFSCSIVFFQSFSGNVFFIFKICVDICKNFKSGDDSGEVLFNMFKSDFRSGFVVGFGVFIEDFDVWGLFFCQFVVWVFY